MTSTKCMCAPPKEVRVHVIYTGGTIGMVRNEKGMLVPVKNELPNRLREYPNCHDKSYTLSPECVEDPPLVLPAIDGMSYRVIYDISEYAPLLDSSCMGLDEWQRIASDVAECYDRYNGFVILHGTDTMAYTASALAFMLENLGKPVVLTGAQIPIFEMRTDGRENLIGALMLAGNYDIPEVLIFFGGKAMRGCRTTKISSDSFNAFDSPNLTPIGKVSLNVEINPRQIFRPCNLGKFNLYMGLDRNVAVLRIYPGITPAVVEAVLAEPVKGAVIQSFGSGNIPSNNAELMCAVCQAINRGVIIVNITQCSNGSVMPDYQTGAWMKKGVVAGCDMTQEAAFTKLAYVLGKKEWDLDSKKKLMQISLRGEITSNKVAKINHIDLIEGVARTLHVSSCKEKDEMCSTFFPALVEAAVRQDDVEKLRNLRQYGATISDVNADGRTALHLACFMNRKRCVNWLLELGCPLDLTDRFNRTALHEAIDTDNHELIALLIKKGAVLPDEPVVLAEQLFALTENGRIERMESYRLAGANLAAADGTGRTALHHACQLGKEEVVKYLLPFYCNPSVKDCLGLGPIQYAKAAEHNNIVALLCASKRI